MKRRASSFPSCFSCARVAVVLLAAAGVPLLAAAAPDRAAPPASYKAQRVNLASGKSFGLELLSGYSLAVAAEGLGRCRFPVASPDGRIFVGDLVNLADNQRGSVWVLEGFDPAARRFRKATRYLENLRNPNGLAFATDQAGHAFFYVATTEKLVRYPYRAGDLRPSGPPETLATFPDYGLSYKYGGWHLTRSLAVTADAAGHHLLVAVGSSCNACVEKEPVRASIQVMDLDGKNSRPYATGLRNPVGLAWVGDRLFATNQGSDHLGPNLPEETLYAVEPGKDYGWPYTYQAGGKVHADPGFNLGESRRKAAAIPLAWATFPAHGSALGLAWTDPADADRRLAGRFLVALHGSSKRSLKRGYQVVIAGRGESPVPFLRGFLDADGKANGRPCGILRLDDRSLLITDDLAGAVYHVRKDG
jgi:glucose/arabinose dehydrogenase